MNRYAKHLFVTFGLFMGAVPWVMGAGFALYEGSARGNALGGLTAQADDPGAIFFNPAGITNLEGIQVMGGGTLISPFVDVATVNGYDLSLQETSYESNVFTPIHAYYTQKLTDKLWFGAGIFTRFGLGSEFDSDWPGRYSNINADIKTLTFNPNIAYKVNDQLSIAAGIRAMWMEVEFVQAIDATLFLGDLPHNPATSDLDAVQTISGDNVGYGFNLAAHYKPKGKWTFGFAYNSEVEHDINDGVARFQRPRAALPDTFFVDSNVDADAINLPQMVFLGANYQYSERMSIALGAIFTGWSSIDQLVFNYETPFVVVPGFDLSVDRVVRELKWEDVWRWNVAFENKLNEKCTFMGSFTWDESPLIDETISYLLPANDRSLWSTGIRYQLSKWTLDGSFGYLSNRTRNIAERQIQEGVLATRVRNGGALLVGFSMSRKF